MIAAILDRMSTDGEAINWWGPRFATTIGLTAEGARLRRATACQTLTDIPKTLRFRDGKKELLAS